MQGIHSFIRSICRFVLNISKKSYRNCAIIVAGVFVVAVVAFSSRLFGGSGKNNGYGSEGLLVRSEQTMTDEIEDDTENKLSDELQAGLVSDDESLQADFDRNEAGKTVSLSPMGSFPASAANGIQQLDEEVVPQIPDMNASEIGTFAEENYFVADVDVSGDTEEFLEQENVKAASFVTTDGTPVTVTMREPREVTEEEYNILLHIAAAEAGGCDIYGRILVVNVILNRVDHKNFPDSIEGVVFQKNQFSPATKGTLWNVNVTEKTKEAVDRALAGEDYSCGALFFAARKRLSEKTMSRFDTKYEKIYEHDGHDFYKYREN